MHESEFGLDGSRESMVAETADVSLAEIMEHLKPVETITTDEGVPHRVFTFHKNGQPIKVIFYQREEMPFSSGLLKGCQPFLFGNQPQHRSEKDWSEYIGKLRAASDPNEDSTNPGVLNVQRREPIFFVERTPRALLDMAAVLGVENPGRINELRKIAAAGGTNDDLEKMQDQVIAARLLDDHSEFKKSGESREEVEAILLRAWCGDVGAQAYLEKKRLELDTMDKTRMVKERAEDRAEVAEKYAHVEALNPKDLIAVHMTTYYPQSTETDDAWTMATTYDATKGRIARTTQHFTLNHPIESAGLYGSWEGSSVCVMMPFDKMLEANGNPAVVNTIDTFWEVSPGRRLLFPKSSAWVIKPGLVGERGVLSHENGHEIMYKTEGIGPEDVTVLTETFDKRSKARHNRELQKVLTKGLLFFDREKFKDVPIIPEDDLKKVYEALGVPTSKLDYGWSEALAFADRDVLAQLQKQSIRDVVEQILVEAGIRTTVGDETIMRMVMSIENFLAKEIKLQVIREKMRQLGYVVHSGGMWAWDGDSFEATAQAAKLGAELGVPGGLPHSGHESSHIEEGINSSTHRLEDGQLSVAGFVARIKDRHAIEASPALRRMMYQMGAI